MTVDSQKVYQILNTIHTNLYNEEHDFSNINVEHHIQKGTQIFYSNPVFNELSKKYTIKDLSENANEIDEERLTEYLCIYIYFEYLYDRIRYSAEEKDKLYNKIKNVGNDNNFFGYVKLYSVYYATVITKWFNNSFFLRLFGSSFLMINILEAVLEDLFNGQFKSCLVGLGLMFRVPFNVCNFEKDDYDNIFTKFDNNWLELYTSWNARFAYSDVPGGDYFPRTSVCLFNAYNYSCTGEWLNNRAYTLFTSHLLKSFNWFNIEFGLKDQPNKRLMNDWNNLNINFGK